MRIVYFGTAPFAVPALERIAPSVVAVVSQPPRPTGRHLLLQPSAVQIKAAELGIPCLTPEKSRGSEFVEALRAFCADLFVVAAYGQILRKSVLEIPERGCVNLHGSLLPEWRGAAPIQRCIEAGATGTGVTLMLMDEGMDTGAMIAKAPVPIGDDETAGELTPRLALVAADLLEANLAAVVEGSAEVTPQDATQATYAAKVGREDANIDLTMDATHAYRCHRAFTPNPGTMLRTNLGSVKVHEARLQQETSMPGVVLSVKPTLVVGFLNGALELREVQVPGRRRASGTEYANGARILPGSCLL